MRSFVQEHVFVPYDKLRHLCFSSIKCLPTSFSQPLTLGDEEEDDDILKSFNSQYDVVSTSTTTTTAATSSLEPDLSSVFASQRFFVSSPGPTNSILEYSSALVEGSVAVRKYSPDPYMDFKRSMEEMVKARREERDRTAENEDGDWEYLHELLLCYLSLNPKHTHKLIVRAFTDLLLSLTSTSTSGGGDGI